MNWEYSAIAALYALGLINMALLLNRILSPNSSPMVIAIALFLWPLFVLLAFLDYIRKSILLAIRTERK